MFEFCGMPLAGLPEIDERANGGKYNLAQTAQRSLMVILDAVHLFE